MGDIGEVKVNICPEENKKSREQTRFLTKDI